MRQTNRRQNTSESQSIRAKDGKYNNPCYRPGHYNLILHRSESREL